MLSIKQTSAGYHLTDGLEERTSSAEELHAFKAVQMWHEYIIDGDSIVYVFFDRVEQYA